VQAGKGLFGSAGKLAQGTLGVVAGTWKTLRSPFRWKSEQERRAEEELHASGEPLEDGGLELECAKPEEEA
jgi:hypothetical protein